MVAVHAQDLKAGRVIVIAEPLEDARAAIPDLLPVRAAVIVNVIERQKLRL
jgi:hypothetical protein